MYMCTDIRKNAQFNELKLKAASLQIWNHKDCFLENVALKPNTRRENYSRNASQTWKRF